jgi:FkbM family methyltransferase
MSTMNPAPGPSHAARKPYRNKRWVRFGALILASAIAALIVGQTDRGHLWLVRSYLRVEEVWNRVVPLNSAKGLIAKAEPFMARVGFFRPVWLQVERGVTMHLDPSEMLSRTVLTSFRTRWDPAVWDAVSGSLCEGCVMLDVGAHIGYFALKSSVRVGQEGRVVAFEPNPRTLDTLRANVAASGATNVTIVPVACTDAETTLKFFDASAGGRSMVSSLSRSTAGGQAQEFTVRGRPIDNVLRELGIQRVDLMKVDVEGAELYVLRGARDTLRRYHPKLVIEVIPDHLAGMNTTVDQLFAFIKDMGYTRGRQFEETGWEWTAQ